VAGVWFRHEKVEMRLDAVLCSSVVIVGEIVCALSQSDAACVGYTSDSQCLLADEACAWITSIDSGGNLENSCVGCSSFNDNPTLCRTHCHFNEMTGTCGGLKMTTLQPTFVDEDGSKSASAIVHGSVLIEMDIVNMDYNMRSAIENALATTFGAEAAFIESVEGEECGLAPLCGDDPQLMDVVEEFSNILLPNLDPCCPLKDTVKTEDCQKLDLTQETCRLTGLNEPFCNDIEAGDSERCEALQSAEDRLETTLAIRLALETTGEEVTCCTSCTCFGDPNCISFDGTLASWRLCDGRDTRENKKCDITRNACEQRTDHEGNRCEWKGDWSAFWKDGSPCQVNRTSGKSFLVMYEADQFRFLITQEERGVIRDAILSTTSGNFTLSAEKCFLGTTVADSWTWSGGDMVDAPAFTRDWRRVEDGNIDILWYSFDNVTGIRQTIRCTGTQKPKDKDVFGNFRLNIEALVEILDNFASVRSNLGGFCVSNQLLLPDASVASQQSLQEHLGVEKNCLQIANQWQELEALAFGRQLCGEGLTLNSLDSCFDDFCSAYAFPSTDVDSCKDLFKKRNLEEGFCSVTSSVQSARTKCEMNIDEFGFEQIISEFFDSIFSGSLLGGECVDSKNQLPTSLGECQSGTTLQIQESDGTWADYLAFPDTVRLCDDLLILNAQEDLDLFTRPVRFQQCLKEASCRALEQCQTQFGVGISLSYDFPRVGTLAPTPSPSTAMPTFVGMTPQPTLPTTSTTMAPTDRETDVPSAAPSILPTSLPSAWPTVAPSISPESCELTCPDDRPVDGTIEGSFEVVEGGACTDTLTFSAIDLESNEFCECNFTAPNAIMDNTTLNLSAACPASYTIEELEQVCILGCTAVDNGSGICEVWELDHLTRICKLYECDFTQPIQYDAAENKSLGFPCDIVLPGRRRELEESGKTIYQMKFLAVFSDHDAQESSTQVTNEMTTNVMNAATIALLNEPALAGMGDRIDVLGIFATETSKYDELRFPGVSYDRQTHTSGSFLLGVCQVLEKTIKKQTDLRRVTCGNKLLDFRSFGDRNGQLVVVYRIQRVQLGAIQEMLATPQGQQEFLEQLANSGIDTVKVLSSASASANGGSSRSELSANLIIAVSVIAVVCAVVIVATAIVVTNNRKKRNEENQLTSFQFAS